MTIIRNASVADLDDVTRLHMVAFPSFFLTLMGNRFLRELYLGFINISNGIFFVAVDDDKVVGFIAGTNSPSVFFSEMRRKRGAFFLLNAVPAIVRHPIIVIKKLFLAFSYHGDKPLTLKNSALLSSLGVNPEVMGKGIGYQLLMKFESDAISRGAKFIYLTTDAVGNDNVKAFYSKCGYSVESTFLQQTHRPMIRYIKKLCIKSY